MRPSSALPCRILSSTKENGSFGSSETSQRESLHISTAIALMSAPYRQLGDDRADRVGLQLVRRYAGDGPSRCQASTRRSAEVAGGGDEERARAAGDVGDLEVEYAVGVDRHPAVDLLVGARVVDERFQRVPDDFLGQRLRGVVRARGRRGRAFRPRALPRGTTTSGRLRRSRRMIPMKGGAGPGAPGRW